MSQWLLVQGDCIENMKQLEDDSVDSCVCDPPYALSFMGKTWDKFEVPGGISNDLKASAIGRAHSHGLLYNKPPEFQIWCQTWATEALRILKPGGHLLAFGGTRTYHRLSCGIEDAGFEIRDCLSWMYGQGFPKSHNLKGEYEGWGTSLKPSYEPIVMARKPFKDSVANNVLQYGTGALNIDDCRICTNDKWEANGKQSAPSVALQGSLDGSLNVSVSSTHPQGRWPANTILIHSEDCELVGHSTQKGYVINKFTDGAKPFGNGAGHPYESEQKEDAQVEIWNCTEDCPIRMLDEQSGVSASRFFYCGKANPKEREAGLENFIPQFSPTMGNGIGVKEHNPETATKKRNTHPTVKPIELMRWLLRLVTPPKGLVLDPFTGSGSTGIGAILEGFDFVGFDLEQEYLDIAEARMAHWAKEVKSEYV